MNTDFHTTDIPPVLVAQGGSKVQYSQILSEIHIPTKLVGLNEMCLDESILRKNLADAKKFSSSNVLVNIDNSKADISR
jgi:hypothetical protein